VTSQHPDPLPQRQRARSAAGWRSWTKLLGPILSLTVVGAVVGTVIATAILGLLTVAAAILFSVGLGMYGSNK